MTDARRKKFLKSGRKEVAKKKAKEETAIKPASKFKGGTKIPGSVYPEGEQKVF